MKNRFFGNLVASIPATPCLSCDGWTACPVERSPQFPTGGGVRGISSWPRGSLFAQSEHLPGGSLWAQRRAPQPAEVLA